MLMGNNNINRVSVIVAILSLIFALINFYLYAQIEAFKNTVEQNKDSISYNIDRFREVESRINKLDNKINNMKNDITAEQAYREFKEMKKDIKALKILSKGQSDKLDLLNNTINRIK